MAIGGEIARGPTVHESGALKLTKRRQNDDWNERPQMGPAADAGSCDSVSSGVRCRGAIIVGSFVFVIPGPAAQPG